MAEVPGLIAPTTVPAGIVTWLIESPVALIGCPTETPAKLDTPVTWLLPAVRVPVGDSTPELATFDIVIVPALWLRAVMVVPRATPVPEIGCPTASPAKPPLGTLVMTALLLVKVPVVDMVVTAVVAVAVFDMVIALPIAEMVVPAWTFGPVIGWPTMSPLVLDTDVMLVLPLVVRPKNDTWLVTVAAAEMTMFVPTAETTVAVEGMPVPLIGCPATMPVTLDTPVIVVLLRVVKPVGATEVVLLALAERVTVVPEADTIKAPAGMKVPVTG